MNSLNYRVAELERKLLNVVRHGIIIEVDHDTFRVRVQLGEQPTGWLLWFTARASGQEASWDAPEIGECVTVVSPNGDTDLGRVMPAVYSQANPPPSNDGEVIMRRHKDGAHDSYDRATQIRTIRLPEDGTLMIAVQGSSFVITKDRILANANTFEVDADTVLIKGNTLTLETSDLNLGGAGGKKLARLGDAIDTNTKKIIGGSDVTSST